MSRPGTKHLKYNTYSCHAERNHKQTSGYFFYFCPVSPFTLAVWCLIRLPVTLKSLKHYPLGEFHIITFKESHVAHPRPLLLCMSHVSPNLYDRVSECKISEVCLAQQVQFWCFCGQAYLVQLWRTLVWGWDQKEYIIVHFLWLS